MCALSPLARVGGNSSGSNSGLPAEPGPITGHARDAYPDIDRLAPFEGVIERDRPAGSYFGRARLKPREAYSTINSAAKDGVKVLEDVMVAAQAGAKNRVRCRPGRSPVTMAAVSTAQSGNRSCNACAMASDANARHGHAQRKAQLQRKHGVTPATIVTDKLGSYRSGVFALA
jgi:hypothetical protein